MVRTETGNDADSQDSPRTTLENRPHNIKKFPRVESQANKLYQAHFKLGADGHASATDLSVMVAAYCIHLNEYSNVDNCFNISGDLSD